MSKDQTLLQLQHSVNIPKLLINYPALELKVPNPELSVTIKPKYKA